MYYYVRAEHFCEIFLGDATDLRVGELKKTTQRVRATIFSFLLS